MIRFSRSQIPVLLADSAFYGSLCEEEEDEIVIPKEYFWTDTIIFNREQALHCLHTIRFWGVYEVPECLQNYNFRGGGAVLEALIPEFGKQLEFLPTLVNLTKVADSDKLVMAIKSGYVHIWQYLYCQNYPTSKNICDIAAEFGNRLSLEYFLCRGFKASKKTCLLAVQSGNVDCLQFVYKQQGRKWDGDAVCRTAVEYGHEACLKFALDQGARSSYAIIQAAASGHLPCLSLLHLYECIKDISACNYAAAGGHLDCLQFLHEHGWEWGFEAYISAAEQGHMHCFSYLLENNCPWSETIATRCATLNRLVFLQRIHKEKRRWNGHAISRAAEFGHLGCVVFLVEHGCPCERQTLAFAARGGHIPCIAYLMQHAACPRDAYACAAAVDHIAALSFLHKHGCPWDSRTCFNAVRRGCLDALVYATEHGCPWSDPTKPGACVCFAVKVSETPPHHAILAYIQQRGCSCSNF